MDDRLDELVLEEDYTSRIDGMFSLLGCEVECSIKNTKTKGEMCMGDYQRIIDSIEPTLLFAGSYEFRKNGTDIIRVLYFPNGLSEICDPEEDIQDFVREYKAYMVGHWPESPTDFFDYGEYHIDGDRFQADSQKKAWAADHRIFNEWFAAICGDDAYVHPRPKRSTRQRRLQCAIPNRFQEKLFSEYCISEIERKNLYDYLAWRWTALEIAMQIGAQTGELGVELPRDISWERNPQLPFYVPALFDSYNSSPYAIFDKCWMDYPSERDMDFLSRDENFGVVTLDVYDGSENLGYSFVDEFGNTAADYREEDGCKISGIFETRQEAMETANWFGVEDPMICAIYRN